MVQCAQRFLLILFCCFYCASWCVGGFSDCGVCSAGVDVPAADKAADSENKAEGNAEDKPDSALPALIYKWVRDNGQTSFGLQPLIEGFQRAEYRFWFTSGSVPGSDVLSWRYACMLQSGVTSLNDQPAIAIEQSCALTPEANACYDLAHDLVKGPYIRSFIQIDNPMPALRLDCGWDPKGKKAFLNEMGVSPGAWIFSECHKLDILCHVAKTLVGYIAPHLKVAPVEVAAIAAAVVNASNAAAANSAVDMEMDQSECKALRCARCTQPVDKLKIQMLTCSLCVAVFCFS